MTSALETVRQQLDRVRSRPFLEAAIAAGALVAWADRQALACERAALESLLQEVDKLQLFDGTAALSLYDGHVEALSQDYEAAKRKILTLVSRFEGDAKAAKALLEVGMAVGRSDRVFVVSEYSEMLELSGALGLNLLSVEF